MPRRRRDDDVAERAAGVPEQQSGGRPGAAARGAQTRRQRREQREDGVQPQTEPRSPTQADLAPSTRPRVDQEMVTVAVRGPIAAKMRELAEQYGMSLARLLQDMVLVYETRLADGYAPGAMLTETRGAPSRGRGLPT